MFDDGPVTLSMHGSVALLTLDDGRANVLNSAVFAHMLKALKVAEEEAGALVLAGRPGFFSAGLDLRVVQPGGDPMNDLLHRCVDLILRLVEFPRPVVAACTGHALATGALMLLCCDIRVGTKDDFKIGFNEISLGMPLPELSVELARSRLSPRFVTLACNTGQIFTPAQAVHVGFLDSTTSGDVVEHSCRLAAGLIPRLDLEAFATTRSTTCRRLSETILRTAGDLLQVRRDIEGAAERRRS